MSARRWSDAVRGLAGTVLLVTLVAGVPWFLATAIGWPLWESVPDLSNALDLLDEGLPDRAFLNVVACLAWLVWAQFTAALLVELVATARGRATPAVPGVPAGMQSAAGRLVAVALLAVAAFASRGPERVAPLPTPADVRADVVLVEEPADPPATIAVASPATDEPREWVVARRDTLWGIAETTLGDGSRYGEILQLNRNRPQPDGGVLRAATDRLQDGWRLRLPADAVLPSDTPAVTDGVYVVQSGDSLSSIAHRVLGDRSQWPVLFELNRGRPQADGTMLTDPDRLSVGWRLEVPGGLPGAVEVRAGDTLSELAADHLGDEDRWTELHDANVGMPQPDGRTLTDPDEIEIGWVLDLPGPSTPGPGTAAPPPALHVVDYTPENLDDDDGPGGQVPEPTTRAELATPTPDEDDGNDEDAVVGATVGPIDGDPTRPADPDDRAPGARDDGAPVSAAAEEGVGSVGAMVAAGLVGLAAALRTRQRRRRRPDTVVPAPSDASRRLEAGLRSVAALDELTLTELALRSLTAGLVDAPSNLAIRSVAVRTGALDVRFDRPLRSSPAGWEGDGPHLRLDPTVDQDVLEALATRRDGRWAPVAAPALVPLGTALDDDATSVFVDLEHLGVVALDGPAEQVAAVMRGVLFGAVSTPWTEECRIVLVGRPGTAPPLPWITTVPTLEDAVAVAEDQAARVAASLGAGGTVAARLAGERPDLRPLVVLARSAPAGDDPIVERLAALESDGRGVALVIGGSVPLVPNALVRDGVLELPDGLRLRPPRLDADEEAELATFLGEATTDAGPRSGPRLVPSVEAQGPGAEVAVLGPVEVRVQGHTVGWSPNGALDLVAWLALHPDAGTSLRDEVPLDEQTWNRIVTEATLTLGVDEQGRTRLVDAGRGLRGATTDLHRFRALVASADTTGHVDLLQEALEIVRGPVLGGPSVCPPWGHAIADAITDEIVVVARRAAETHLALGEPEAARRSLELGLRADPGDESLWRALLAIVHEHDGAEAAEETAAAMRTAVARIAGRSEVLLAETEDMLDRLQATRESA